MFEVMFYDGQKLMHTCDNQTSETLPIIEHLDVLMLNAWVNESGGQTPVIGMRIFFWLNYCRKS